MAVSAGLILFVIYSDLLIRTLVGWFVQMYPPRSPMTSGPKRERDIFFVSESARAGRIAHRRAVGGKSIRARGRGHGRSFFSARFAFPQDNAAPRTRRQGLRRVRRSMFGDTKNRARRETGAAC